MWTKFVQHAEAALCVTEGHILFAQNLYAQRLTIGFSNFFDQAYRGPVLPHEARHRSIAVNAREQLVFLESKHQFLLERNEPGFFY